MQTLTSEGQAFSALVLEIFRINGAILDAGDRLTRPVGLSSARWQVLGVVEHGPVAVPHVARTMGLARQSVQQTADALAQEGFITFEENPHHRRSKLMRITAKGQDALAYVARQHAAWANQLGAAHSAERLHDAAALLHTLCESLALAPLPESEPAGR
ncbi:MarR family transcriptional regulator [Chloroflexia bacterium SDU3-3]|nr:MarR family transcriptional regulator [Chloroflexia bacterium SDU3-3]